MGESGSLTAMMRILVVDDDADMRRLARRTLEDDGYLVDVAGDAKTAVDMIRRAEYAAVLMDLQMPEMDGFAAATTIRAMERELNREPVPIFPFSSEPPAKNRPRREAATMSGYVAKPVEREELLRAMELGVRERSSGFGESVSIED